MATGRPATRAGHRPARGIGQMRTCIILNPTAGRRRREPLRQFIEALQAGGAQVRVLVTRHAGHGGELARQIVREGATDCIIAAGGDGTIAEIAQAVAGTPQRMGIFPAGSANVLALELGIPFAPAAAARLVLSGACATIWPGVIESTRDGRPAPPRLFVQMAGIGFDACVVHRLPLRLKRLVGRAGYVLTMLGAAMTYRFPLIDVRIDGTAYQARAVVVSKGRLYGGAYVICPQGMHHQAGFCAIMQEKGGIIPTLRMGWALLRGRVEQMPDVRIVCGRDIDIHAAIPIPVQTDGDISGTTPVRIRDAGRPLRLAIDTTARPS